MHRSSAAGSVTAAFLVSVAVSVTASGCVGVERPSGPAPTTTPASPSASPGHGKSRPQTEQGPGREVLQRMTPPPHPAPRKPAVAARPVAPPPRPEQPPPPPARKPPAVKPDAGAARPAPPVVKPLIPDVCALGEAYGGWQPGSPESAICHKAYGR